ncbi:MAG: hypothetical protein QM690_21780 [Sphingobium sp.]
MLLAGCDRHPAESGNHAANAGAGNAAAPKHEDAASAEERASEAAFGKSMTFEQDGQAYRYVEHKLVAAPFGPVLLSKAEGVDAPHVSSGLLSATYLKKDGQGFTVVRRFPAAVKSGSFGAFSDWAIRDDLAANPVAQVEGGGTWQGYSCGWTSFTELTPAGPVELVTYQDSYSDGGAVEDDSSDIDSRIVKVDRGRAFTVHFSGTRTFDAVYERHGNKYELLGGDAHMLSGC